MRGCLLKSLSFLVLFGFAACKKDKPDGPGNTLPPAYSEKVLIACEGSLGNGNAALSVYDIAADSVYTDVFNAANQQSLGDVLQSMLLAGPDCFLMVNNSDRITVVDSGSFRIKGSISVSKPRYMLQVSQNKAYVGELFQSKLAVIDPSSRRLIKEMPLQYRNVEQMMLWNNLALIANWDENCRQVYLLDTATDLPVDSIALPGYAPSAFVQDKEGHVWVLAGNVFKGKPATLSCLDIGSRSVLRSFTFPAKADPIKICRNNRGDTLLFIEVNYDGGTDRNGVFKMGINQSTLPETPFIGCVANQYFWALGVHPQTGELYVGDPKGFVQKSSVTIYSEAGVARRQFSCGIGVSSFCFK